MKILKIEIQNINSLKCKDPIQIDFTTEHFKDVGLFAIVGTTGAGKTTVLDAITIALYHRVPRSKGLSLTNIVSYGAKYAKVNVTFENKLQVYEATWSIKLYNAKHIKLKQPTEEVRLKNLTTQQIIGEKKREIQNKIIEIIQLDYDQFLRSVMLAQGDFASFLSAKGSEKAKLLEQITGEQIYKKIGEAILQKRSNAKKILFEITSKLNNLDILNDDEKEQLNIELKDISLQLSNLNKQQIDYDKILHWHTQNIALISKKTTLEKQFKELQINKTQNAPILKKLTVHEKALPFKELVTEIKRLEPEIENKHSKIKSNKLQLLASEKTIIVLSKKKKSLIKTFQDSEETFKTWLPKLDEIVKLDSNLKNETNKKEAFEKIELTLKEQLKVVNSEVSELKTSLNSKKNNSEKINTFLLQNKNIPIIENNFTNWSSQLSIIQRDFKFLNEERIALNLHKNNRENINNELIKFSNLEKEQHSTLTKLNILLEKSKKYFENNNLGELQKEKDTLFNLGTKWRALENISLEFHEKTKAEKRLLITQQETKSLISKFTNNILELKKRYEIANKNFNDYTIIYNQNIRIISLESERKFLKEGNPCKLCGSKEHPLLAEYTNLSDVDSEKELNKRKIILEDIDKLLQENNIQFTKKDTELNSITKNITVIKQELGYINEKAIKLKLEVNIANLDLIKDNLIQTIKTFNNKKQEIELIITKTKEKESLIETITKHTEIFNVTKNDITQFTEKRKNEDKIIAKLTTIILNKQNEIDLVYNQLKTQFNNNQLELPKLKDVSSFIVKVEKDLLEYKLQKENYEKLKNTIKLLEKDIVNKNEILLSKGKENQNNTENINNSIFKITELSKNRIEFLPFDISVSKKRESLNNALISIKNKLEKSNEEVQKEKNSNSNLIALIKSMEGELSLDINKWKIVNNSFDERLNSSEFSNKKLVFDAFLMDDVFQQIKKVSNDIEERTIQLSALKETLEKDQSILNIEKKSDLAYQDVIYNIEKIKKDRSRIIERSGKITERIKKNNQILERNKTVQQKIVKQEKIIEKWVTLLEIIGGSKDAFNTYVQRLTLQQLIKLANVHLKKLNKRYSLLIKNDNSLNFNLIDNYQAGETRDVDTSSGGEKFLISLSLALGLSDLASNNVKIDSLFIDEGFGSLDTNTLETVISALETLQSQGKIIGIISHVDSLKERIPTQIQVIKKNNGVSTVTIV